MLSEPERTRADEILRASQDRQEACIALLRIVQDHRRWIDDEAVADVADHLGLSTAEVESVATFYNLLFRREVGRHVVFVCESVSCWLMGADATRRTVEEVTGATRGRTSADGRFTVLPIQCLGACDRAPVVMVDEELHVHVSSDAVARMLEGHE